MSKESFIQSLKEGVQLSQMELSLAETAYEIGKNETICFFQLYEKTKAFIAERWVSDKDLEDVKDFLHEYFGEFNDFNIKTPFDRSKPKTINVSDIKNFINNDTKSDIKKSEQSGGN